MTKGNGTQIQNLFDHHCGTSLRNHTPLTNRQYYMLSSQSLGTSRVSCKREDHIFLELHLIYINRSDRRYLCNTMIKQLEIIKYQGDIAYLSLWHPVSFLSQLRSLQYIHHSKVYRYTQED